MSAYIDEGHADIVKELLANNVDVNAKNIEGRTALSYAAKNNHLEIVKLLKKAGAIE